jgi:hypothetical protein
MQKLNILALTKETYALVFKHYKLHILLAYVFFLPITILAYNSGLSTGKFIDPKTLTFVEGAGSTIFYGILFIMFFSMLLSIFYFRLYSLGKDKFLNISGSDTFKVLSKYTLYYILFILVLFISAITVGLLIGIIIAVIKSNMQIGTVTILLDAVIPMVLMLIFAIISCKLNLTFISIARNEKTIIFKNSWFYTTDHIKSMLLIYALTAGPAYIFVVLINYLIAQNFEAQSQMLMIVSGLIAPISALAISFACAAGSLIYKEISQNFVNDL